MKKFVALSFAAIVLVGFMAPELQGQTAKIKVEALSPFDIDKMGWTSPTSNGLSVVGKGETVYLSGWEAGGEVVTAFSWSLEGVPTGSQATLDSTDKQWTTLVPDTIGQYEVKLMITTATGTADVTMMITSAIYVGVGGMDPRLPASIAKGQCALCHADMKAGWDGTHHSNNFIKHLDGLGSPHFVEDCLECHTTGYNKVETAVNGGFDDVAKALGWVFPAVLQAGNWDSLVVNFADVAHMGNVQCESCHGPGSLHFGAKDKIDISLDEGMCGRCHESPPYNRINIQWSNSGHSIGYARGATIGSCQRCHSGFGFIKFIDPDTKFEGTHSPQVTCAVCHDPHSTDAPNQLRQVENTTLNNGVTVTTGGKGRFCMNCHISRRNAEIYVQNYADHFGPHHSNQTDMFVGENAITFGMNVPKTNHAGVIENGCVTCHMAETPGADSPAHDKIGEHSWAMSYTDSDTEMEYDNVAACVKCHGPVTSFDDFKAKVDYDKDGVKETTREELKGLMDQVGMMLPPLGDVKVVVDSANYDHSSPTLTDEEKAKRKLYLRAAYNYEFVADDASHGFHNYQYAINLLRLAHAALTTGSLGAAPIYDITDVPNDQGKQVRLSWNRFGGDGVGTLNYYGMWRKVDEMAMGKSNSARVFESFDKVAAFEPAKLEGARVKMDMDLWDFVGMVPAAGLDMYSAVVPTLFDSTADGMHWSYFVVSGHTGNAANVMVTEPDSGYSVDNLAPEAPASLSVEEMAGGAVLSWDETVAEDLKYYAVYRGTEANFDPTGTEPLKKTAETSFIDADVTVNETYYYKVSGIDFAGNEGTLSKEVSLVVTSIAITGLNTVPEDFSLLQNFPNPFNPSTEITFGLPNEDYIKVSIYNVLGEKVKTLTEGTYGAGFHRFVWDASDDFGKQVAPGMYIYRLEGSFQTITKKMILLK